MVSGLIVRPQYRAVHRLHSGVRQKRQLVDGLDGPGGAGHRLDDVAFLFGDHSGSVCGLFKLCNKIGGREMGVRAAVLRDVEGSQAFFGGPHMIRDNNTASIFEQRSRARRR